MIDLDGKTAIVTGGSRGIGRAISEALAEAGARVVVNCKIEVAWADRVVKHISEGGGEAMTVVADVARPDEAELLVQETLDRFGGVDILVNNAGVWRRTPIVETTPEAWEEIVATNQTGPFHVLRATVPALEKAGGGSIVNVSSTAGRRGEAFHSAYAASKAALLAMTKSLAVELAPIGVRVNAVAPGWTRTDMTRDVLDGPEGDAIARSIPLGRVGEPLEVAYAVLFLVSDLASFITGEVVNVNGGGLLDG